MWMIGGKERGLYRQNPGDRGDSQLVVLAMFSSLLGIVDPDGMKQLIQRGVG